MRREPKDILLFADEKGTEKVKSKKMKVCKFKNKIKHFNFN